MDEVDPEDSERIRSLEMDNIGELFESDRMPVTTEELIEEFGDCEIEYPHGSERLEPILRTSGMEQYETLDELELAILNGVSRDAVGRPRYSDRGDEHLEDSDREDQSL